MGESFPQETEAAEKLEPQHGCRWKSVIPQIEKMPRRITLLISLLTVSIERERRDSSWPGDCHRHDHGYARKLLNSYWPHRR
jgi:hypothetical protein